jgi:hypothetical protein
MPEHTQTLSIVYRHILFLSEMQTIPAYEEFFLMMILGITKSYYGPKKLVSMVTGVKERFRQN